MTTEPTTFKQRLRAFIAAEEEQLNELCLQAVKQVADAHGGSFNIPEASSDKGVQAAIEEWCEARALLEILDKSDGIPEEEDDDLPEWSLTDRFEFTEND